MPNARRVISGSLKQPGYITTSAARVAAMPRGTDDFTERKTRLRMRTKYPTESKPDSSLGQYLGANITRRISAEVRPPSKAAASSASEGPSVGIGSDLLKKSV